MDLPLLVALIGLCLGIGVADAAARSWRILTTPDGDHREPPATNRYIAGRLVHQLAASATGAGLWIAVAAAWWTGPSQDTADALAAAGGALAPLLLVFLARMPVLGRPVLELILLAVTLRVVVAAPAVGPPLHPWLTALLGLSGFLICRSALGPARPRHTPHGTPALQTAGSSG